MVKVLVIAHYFPPVGGAGVQRVVKFVKYLPSLGFLPIILTSEAQERNRWTPEDDSLLAEIPASVPIFRAKTGGNSSSQHRKSELAKQRITKLLELGHRIITEHKPSLIFVTMSPFDDALVAAELARVCRLPWIADLRDPWALDEFQVYRTFWHRWRERRLMARRLTTADSIIMNTPEAMRQFRRTFPHLASKAAVSITNGFDSADFSGSRKVMYPSKFNIVHSGYFHADHGLRQQRRRWEYRLLGRTEPGVELLSRSHYYLIRAIQKWLRSSPQIADKVALVCLGKPSDVDQLIVDEAHCSRIVTFAGYMPHAECLKYVNGADLLFLPMHCMPVGKRATIVPGKTYEYLASGRPILAAVPEGDACDFVREAGTGAVCAPNHVDGMLKILRTSYASWEKNRGATQEEGPKPLERFERRRLAAQLAEEFTRILNRARI